MFSQEDFKELFLKKMLLEALYSKEWGGFNLDALKNTFDKITPENTFDNIYKELFEKLDNNKSIDPDDGEKMFIYQSNLKHHQSFFIFHVDKDNKLTSISYCDGNSVDERRGIKGSATHINGVTTFNLKAPIEYRDNFAQNFIEKNTQNQKKEDFYEKFTTNAIEIKGAEIDYSQTIHSIPTKIQVRGNCVFKSTSLLARFISGKINPDMNFDFDIDTQKPTGVGYDEYKKFKDYLIKNTLESVLEIKEKISSKSDSFSEYLKKIIEDIISRAEEQNIKKLSKDDDPRKEFHEAIRDLLPGVKQETPGSSFSPYGAFCRLMRQIFQK